MVEERGRPIISQGRGVSPGIRALRGRRGGSLVEFVIVLPMLIALLFGIWEFGRIFDAWLVSTNAAREGARYGAESTLTGSALQTYVQGKVLNYVSSGYGTRLGLGDVHIPLGNIVVEELTGNQIRVIVRADVDIWAPAMDALAGGGPFRVTAWTTMRK